MKKGQVMGIGFCVNDANDDTTTRWLKRREGALTNSTIPGSDCWSKPPCLSDVLVVGIETMDTGRSGIMTLEDQVRAILDEAVARGDELGCRSVMYKDGEKAVDVCAGYADAARTVPVGPETLFPRVLVWQGDCGGGRPASL